MSDKIEFTDNPLVISGKCAACGDEISKDRYCSCRATDKEIEDNEIAFQQGEITYKELDEMGKRISEDMRKEDEPYNRMRRRLDYIEDLIRQASIVVEDVIEEEVKLLKEKAESQADLECMSWDEAQEEAYGKVLNLITNLEDNG